MKKGFFSNLNLNDGKKSLKFGGSFWNWLFLMSIFCGTLFMALQPSISGEAQVYNMLTFYDTSLLGPDSNTLSDKIDIYIYQGTNAPDSPFSGSGLATGVDKLGISDGLLKCVVMQGTSVTIYTNPKAAYDQSAYAVKDANQNVLVPLISNNPRKYGLGQITSDTNIIISDLKKNPYSITFASGDSNYSLSDRVDLYKEDGTTPVSDWTSGITVYYGDNIGFVIKSKTGYDLNSINIKLNGVDVPPDSKSESQITLSLVNVTENKAFTMTNIKYRQYNIYFKDENGATIDADRANIVDRATQNNINENYKLTWKSSLSFRVDLQAKYNHSSIVVTVGDQTLTSTEDSTDHHYYYTFTMSTPQDSTIVISGITINRYSGDFSLDNSTFNDQVKVFYNGYTEQDDQYYQTGSSAEFCPTSTTTTQDLSIPHGNNFQFSIQILNTNLYGLNYDGTVDRSMTYGSSSENFSLDSIINASSVKGAGVENITYNVNSAKTQVVITFENVTDDVNVQVKSLKKVNYTINFNVPSGTENHISLYKGSLMSFYNSTGYFIMGDQIYGPNGTLPISTSAVKSEKFYFAVKFDNTLATDPGGIQCTIASGTGSGIITTPSYTVYSSQDFSVIKIFEVSGVESSNISINISGIYFAKRSVNFSIGNATNSTATVTNYANEYPITDDSPLSVNYGDSIKFKIVANEGYYLDDISKQVVVKIVGQTQGQSFDYESYSDHADVTISNITENLNVSINLDTEKMPITFNNIEGLKYYSATLNTDGTTFSVNGTNVLKGIVTVPYNGNYYFAVKAETGYDISSTALKSNDVDVGTGQSSGDYLVFKVSSVTANVSITGSISKIKYNVSFDTSAVITAPDKSYDTTITYLQDGVKITGDSVAVQYGDNTFFQVELADECNQSNLKVSCSASSDSASSEPLSSVNGTYTITDITQNIMVKVENLTLNQYVINFVGTDSAYYVVDDAANKITSDTRVVSYNSSYSFGVEAKPGYVIGSSMVVNYKTSSGVTKSLIADASSGKYTISNIKESCTISIENVDNIIYNITLTPIDGVTYYNDTGSVISGNIKIKYGQNFEFAVGVADAYDDSISGMYIVVNDGLSSNVSAQKLSSGRYIIANMTQDITIKVGNITKNKYTVTLTKIEGIDYYGESGKIITGDNTVEYKGSLTFRVYLYPAYADSSITVRLGDKDITSDSDGMYTISSIDENKIITVLGVKLTKAAELVNKINSLPLDVYSTADVNLVIEATRLYNNLSDEEKKSVTNISKLEALQEKVKSILHTANSVTVDGVDWYIKLVANPISSDADACSRIYGKLSSEYILSLYDIYLWDTLNDKRYELPEGQSVTVTLPMPDMTYFENPTGVHESSSDGKLEFPTLTLKSTIITFSTSSFSAMGVIANRSSTPGKSSLLDAVDANVEAIKEYALTNYNSSSSSNSSASTATNSKNSTTTTDTTTEETSGNISNKFKSSSNNVTVEGSALRLILVLMIMILIAVSLWVIVKNRNKINTKNGK